MSFVIININEAKPNSFNVLFNKPIQELESIFKNGIYRIFSIQI